MLSVLRAWPSFLCQVSGSLLIAAVEAAVCRHTSKASRTGLLPLLQPTVLERACIQHMFELCSCWRRSGETALSQNMEPGLCAVCVAAASYVRRAVHAFLMSQHAIQTLLTVAAVAKLVH